MFQRAVKVVNTQNMKIKYVMVQTLDFKKNYLDQLNLVWLINCYKESSEKEKSFNNFFDKLAGNDKLRKQIISEKSIDEIRKKAGKMI